MKKSWAIMLVLVLISLGILVNTRLLPASTAAIRTSFTRTSTSTRNKAESRPDMFDLFVGGCIVIIVLCAGSGIVSVFRKAKKEEERQERLRKHEQDEEQRLREKSAHRQFIAKQRRLMSDSLRYDVLHRDGFRCQICGATQKDGVKLHVDHILPVSKGGRTEMSNLRTLCERCNMGKRDKIETPQVDEALTPDEFAERYAQPIGFFDSSGNEVLDFSKPPRKHR